MDNTKKIAIVHDFLSEYGGAEVVLQALLELYPDADLYTGEVDKKVFPKEFLRSLGARNITTSITDILRSFRVPKKMRSILHLAFFQNIDFRGYDSVIVSSSGFAKWINLPENCISILYIHTPPRFIWGMESSFFSKLPKILKNLLRPIIKKWQRNDKRYTKEFDRVIVNSKNIEQKVKDIYSIESNIIYPPILNEVTKDQSESEDYYLIINRLVSYKHIDKIIKYFNAKKDENLIIIGDGPERESLERLKDNNTQMLGFVDNETKFDYLSRCKALIYPGEEDFGISMVEAFSFGKPVIAYNKGGAVELVSDDKGNLFSDYTIDELDCTFQKFNNKVFDPKSIKEFAKNFSKDSFKYKIQQITNI